MAAFHINVDTGKIYPENARVRSRENVSWRVDRGAGIVVFWTEPAPVCFQQVIATPDGPAEGKVRPVTRRTACPLTAVVRSRSGVETVISGVLVIDP